MKVLNNASELSAELSKIKFLPPDAMSLEGYKNLGYSCGCGEFHSVNSPSVLKVATAFPVKFVLACATHYTFVSMRGLFKTTAVSEWTAQRAIFEAEVERLQL